MQCKLPLPNTNELLSMCVIFVPNEESDEDGDDEANGEAAEGEPAERASGTGGTEGCNTVLTTEECMSNNMGHGVRGEGGWWWWWSCPWPLTCCGGGSFVLDIDGACFSDLVALSCVGVR